MTCYHNRSGEVELTPHVVRRNGQVIDLEDTLTLVYESDCDPDGCSVAQWLYDSDLHDIPHDIDDYDVTFSPAPDEDAADECMWEDLHDEDNMYRTTLAADIYICLPCDVLVDQDGRQLSAIREHTYCDMVTMSFKARSPQDAQKAAKAIREHTSHHAGSHNSLVTARFHSPGECYDFWRDYGTPDSRPTEVTA